MQFGAWSHWDRQSLQQRGDRYEPEMYMREQPSK